jgi:hypothetical protein
VRPNGVELLVTLVVDTGRGLLVECYGCDGYDKVLRPAVS